MGIKINPTDVIKEIIPHNLNFFLLSPVLVVDITKRTIPNITKGNKK